MPRQPERSDRRVWSTGCTSSVTNCSYGEASIRSRYLVGPRQSRRWRFVVIGATASSWTLRGVAGHRYLLRVRARDNSDAAGPWSRPTASLFELTGWDHTVSRAVRADRLVLRAAAA